MKITVSGVGNVILSSDNGYEKWLRKKGIECLLFEGAEVPAFEDLVDGGTYSLGPSIKQQQQKQRELVLFNLEFDDTPTGSSGVPHIHSDLEEYPMDRLRKLPLQTCETPIDRFYHVLDDQENGKLKYSRELHIQTHLEEVFKDVIRGCKYKLKTGLESSLNGLRVDIGVIRNSCDVICGTTEVKQPKRVNVLPPDPDPMKHGKVITQVVSQMIPLRTVYGVKNVYGILSTYSSWRFFKWVPEDEADEVCVKASPVTAAEKRIQNLRLSNTLDTASNDSPNQFQTPQKGTKTSYRKASPPLSPSPYIDADEIHGEGDVIADSSRSMVHQGVVYASDVIEAGPKALKMLAWVLGEMANSPVENLPAHERDYLYVVQKDAMGGYEKLPHETSYYKGRMPNPRNTKLYLLDELGHRNHGRVYRAMSKNGNLCVLKYFVKSQVCQNENGKRVELSSELVAQKAADYWNLAYSNWLPQASHGKWGGGDAIIMPDLERATANIDLDIVYELLKESMQKQFYSKGLWHLDAAWRNIALVKNSKGLLTKACMIDLEPQHMLEKTKSKWKDFDNMWEPMRRSLEEQWGQFREKQRQQQ